MQGKYSTWISAVLNQGLKVKDQTKKNKGKRKESQAPFLRLRTRVSNHGISTDSQLGRKRERIEIMTQKNPESVPANASHTHTHPCF